MNCLNNSLEEGKAESEREPERKSEQKQEWGLEKGYKMERERYYLNDDLQLGAGSLQAYFPYS